MTETLDERYELLDELGGGSQGLLYVGMDLDTGQRVAIKELDLSVVDEWKSIELFEREADILESLDHAGIPAYVDSFHLDQESGTRFFLVQDYVDGTPLKQRFEAVDLMDEDDAKRFLLQVLDILSYLQSLSPPVVHRDIKPSNLIERPDGSFALIDFGAVQTILPEAMGGSTVVGTTGYMPPEQLMGRAVPASDLYALAATVVAMMSGIEPEDLPVERMKLQFRDHLDASDHFAEFLDRMLDPEVEQRLQDADEALEALESGQLPAQTAPQTTSSTGESGWDRLQQELEKAGELEPYAPHTDITVTRDEMRLDMPAFPADVKGFIWPFVGAVIAIVAGLLNCCLFPVGLAIMISLIWGSWKHMFPRSEHILINSDTLTVEERRNGKVKDSKTMNVDQMYLPRANQVDDAMLNMSDKVANGGRQNWDFKMMKHGLVLSDRQGQEEVFGREILSKNKIADPNTFDDGGELEWLAANVTAYLKYVRGEFDE